MREKTSRRVFAGTYWVLASYFTLQNHSQNQFRGANLSFSSQETSDLWGWSDPGSYVKLGRAFVETGGVPGDYEWIINLWTPGMSAVNASAIFLFGLNGNYLIGVIFLNLLVWFFALYLIFKLVTWFFNDFIAAIVTLWFVTSDFFQDYLIGYLAVYSDGLSTGITTIVISLILLMGRKKWSTDNPRCITRKQLSLSRHFRIEETLIAAVAGLLLGCLVYLRGQYFLVIQLGFVLLAIIYISKGIRKTVSFVLLSSARSKLNREGLKIWQRSLPLRPSQSTHWALIFVSLVAASLSLLPYALWKSDRIGDIPWDTGGAYALTSSDSFAFMANWGSDFPDFISQGGQGSACRIDPELCAEVQAAEMSSDQPFSIYDSEPFTAKEFRSMTLRTIASHPISWVSDRAPYLWKYLTAGDDISVPESSHRGRFLSQLGLIAIVPFLKRKDRITHEQIQFSLPPLSVLGPIAIIVVAVLGPPMLTHFETRYLLSIRVAMEILSKIGAVLLLQIFVKWLRTGLELSDKVERRTNSVSRFRSELDPSDPA